MTETCKDFDKDKLMSLWRTIGGKTEYSSSRSKSAHIRNPAIQYAHKAIASTFFARKVTWDINEGELQMIDIVLRIILDFTRDGRVIHGDILDTRLSIALLDQLLYYRGNYNA